MMPKKPTKLSTKPIPYITMVVGNPSFEYGFFETHTFAKFASPSTPFVQLIHLLKKWS